MTLRGLWNTLALAALLAALLAGCAAPAVPATPTAPAAGATASAAPTPSPQPATPSPQPATPSPQPAPSTQQLSVWAVADEADRDGLRQLITDAAVVAGVRVTVSLTSADGLSADVRAAELAGLPLPDVVWGSQDDLGILQRAGALRPAEDGLADGDFLPAVVEGATVGGRRWGTPLGAQGFLLLLYNRTIVDSAPSTTDDLIVRARARTGGGSYGLVAGWAEARWFAAWLRGAGGSALGPDGKPALDTPQTVAALDLLRALRGAGPPPPSSYDQGARLFRDGRVAYAVDGDWSLDYYRRFTETLDLAIAPMPRVSGTGRAATGPLGGLYLMYGAGLEGARLEAAYALGRTLARPELQERVARDLGALPALRASLGGPAVTGDSALAAAAQGAADAPGIPPLDELRCAWDAIEVALPLAILGDLTTEEAAARMQERATACAGG